MNEYTNFIAGMGNAAPAQAVAGIDDNPDQAAEALNLSQSTGTPSTAIYGDLDEYKRQHKAALATRLIRGNSELGDYIASHPLAPAISNDDYGNLSVFSSGAKQSSALVRILQTPRAVVDAAVS